jgi:hypothetical protein
VLIDAIFALGDCADQSFVYSEKGRDEPSRSDDPAPARLLWQSHDLLATNDDSEHSPAVSTTHYK